MQLKGKDIHNDEEAVMQTSLIWDNQESQRGWFWWGIQDNPWGLKEVSVLLALHSCLMMPALAWGMGVCAHLWWSWWGQSRLSSALMWPIAHLSCGKHLPLTFIVQLHHGVAGRRQNRTLLLKRKKMLWTCVSRALRKCIHFRYCWLVYCCI